MTGTQATDGQWRPRTMEDCDRLFAAVKQIQDAHNEAVRKVMVVDEVETNARLAELAALGGDAMVNAIVPESSRSKPSLVKAYMNVYRSMAEGRALRFFEANPDEAVYRDAAVVFRRVAA